MTSAEFETEVTQEDALRFAELSGDWNPLHTDSAYAAGTSFRRPILHGAFSAGLVSRMAGMHIPGHDCLLHSIRLKFVAPIRPPVRLRIKGSLLREVRNEGTVEVQVSDAESGTRYVDGTYEFGRYGTAMAPTINPRRSEADDETPLLVTGASGGLGSALLARLSRPMLGVSRAEIHDLSKLPEFLAGRKVAGIVHCGWPAPDNQRLTQLGSNVDRAIHHHVAEPLADCIKLAQVLATCGVPGAALILVGSTAALPGRHNWRTPLYSLSKSLVPWLAQILALELGAGGQRCLGVVFDVIDGGMNSGMRESVRLAHIDRSPFGLLASRDEAAGQIEWLLDNASHLVSGAVVTLSGAALL